MEENKRMIETNTRAVAEANDKIEQAKKFLGENTAKVQANKSASLHEMLSLHIAATPAFLRSSFHVAAPSTVRSERRSSAGIAGLRAV